MPVEYVRMGLAGIDAALGLMRQFYTEQSIPFHEDLARPALTQLATQPEHGGLWFLQLDGTAMGYFVVTACYSLEFGGRFALLDEFFVLPAWRRARLGTQALEFITAEARRMQVRAVRLEVDQHDPGLQGFYGRSGFRAHQRDLMTKWL